MKESADCFVAQFFVFTEKENVAMVGLELADGVANPNRSVGIGGWRLQIGRINDVLLAARRSSSLGEELLHCYRVEVGAKRRTQFIARRATKDGNESFLAKFFGARGAG